ncbi:MAG: hypothetical protein EOM54_07925 [Clostridia bacterium]|nr:hypothetical protein [Clostridia bacterium]
MTRIIGAVLIVAAFSLAGAVMSAELKARARRLAALCSALELMRGEVVDRLAPVPEIAERLASSGPEGSREFFRCLSSEMEGIGERAFSEIWSYCAGTMRLRPDDHEALCGLGRCLGRYGADEQDAAISRCMALLGASAKKAEDEAASGVRLYGGLGVTVGLLIAVVLI